MKKIIALILAMIMVLSLAACGGNGGASGEVDFSKMNVTAIVPYDAGGATGMLYGANAKNDGSILTMITVELATLEAIPDVPTAKECGYDAVLGTWRGLAVPASTPDEVVNKLYEIFSAAAESDAFKEFMNNTNNVIDIMDGASFNTMIGEQLELYTALVDDLGLKIG